MLFIISEYLPCSDGTVKIWQYEAAADVLPQCYLTLKVRCQWRRRTRGVAGWSVTFAPSLNLFVAIIVAKSSSCWKVLVQECRISG